MTIVSQMQQLVSLWSCKNKAENPLPMLPWKRLQYLVTRNTHSQSLNHKPYPILYNYSELCVTFCNTHHTSAAILILSVE
jgi:hypothetical protein